MNNENGNRLLDMTNKLKEYKEKVFEDIKHIDKEGNEYWYARELMEVLGYAKWQNFSPVIDKAKNACLITKKTTFYDFTDVSKIVKAGATTKNVLDYKLSRYACYLIVQNGDSRKKSIALGQTYFAIQTRKQELSEEEYEKLSEDEKRLYRRGQTKDGNKALYSIAKSKGVKNFDKFTNAGYRGLYGGETADDIAKRKGLRYREEILDNMGSEELGDNIFRIVQTESLLKRQKEENEIKASNTHYIVGKAVRDTIKRLGNTMPENLPTPDKSLKEINMNNEIERNDNGATVSDN